MTLSDSRPGDRQKKMILTNCAACAVPLAYDHKKKCSRCKTRYCNEACQRQHWERGGHEALCRRIKRGGGAEQYYADKKHKEAVAVAVEACADDTIADIETPMSHEALLQLPIG